MSFVNINPNLSINDLFKDLTNDNIADFLHNIAWNDDDDALKKIAIEVCEYNPAEIEAAAYCLERLAKAVSELQKN